MKNLFIVLSIAGLTSCSKDSIELNSANFSSPELSEIAVSVSYLTWDEECLDGCGDNGQRVVFIENASLSLYKTSTDQSDATEVIMDHLETDYNGLALFEGLEPGVYKLEVETAFGEKFRTITTQLHKRAFVDFSF